MVYCISSWGTCFNCLQPFIILLVVGIQPIGVQCFSFAFLPMSWSFQIFFSVHVSLDYFVFFSLRPKYLQLLPRLVLVSKDLGSHRRIKGTQVAKISIHIAALAGV